MSEEIAHLSSGDLENRVRSGQSTVDSASLPHGGSSGAHSGTPSFGLGGEKRRAWEDEQAAKLPPVALPKTELKPNGPVRHGELGANAEVRTDDADQT